MAVEIGVIPAIGVTVVVADLKMKDMAAADGTDSRVIMVA